MKDIVNKILNIDLVSKDLVEHMEKWGLLTEGSSDKYKEILSTKRHKEKLKEWAEDLAASLEEEQEIKETNLDLDRLHWTVEVGINTGKGSGLGDQIAYKLPAVIDRLGRYFFRIQDVKEEWFVPGYFIVRDGVNLEDPNLYKFSKEIIGERQVLFIGELPVCIQVTTIK